MQQAATEEQSAAGVILTASEFVCIVCQQISFRVLLLTYSARNALAFHKTPISVIYSVKTGVWRITKSRKRHIVWLLQVANGLVFTNVNTIGPWNAASMPHLEPLHKKRKKKHHLYFILMYLCVVTSDVSSVSFIFKLLVWFPTSFMHILIISTFTFFSLPVLPNKTYQQHNMANASEIWPAYSRTSLNEMLFHCCTRRHDTVIMLI